MILNNELKKRRFFTLYYFEIDLLVCNIIAVDYQILINDIQSCIYVYMHLLYKLSILKHFL